MDENIIGAIFAVVLIVVAIRIKSRSKTTVDMKSQRTAVKNMEAFKTEMAEEFVPQKINQVDEYKTEETYYTEKAPYGEEKPDKDAYAEEIINSELSTVEKGIVFAEIFGKPVSMRRR